MSEHHETKNAPDADQGVEGNRIDPHQRSHSVPTIVQALSLKISPVLSIQCDMKSPSGLRCVETALYTAEVHAWPCTSKAVTICLDCLSYYYSIELPAQCNQCEEMMLTRADVVSGVLALGGAR